jgi:hypothetical protein
MLIVFKRGDCKSEIIAMTAKVVPTISIFSDIFMMLLASELPEAIRPVGFCSCDNVLKAHRRSRAKTACRRRVMGIHFL